MSKPIVAQLPDGREYGFDSAADALEVYPDADIVRYQDGTAIDPVAASTAPLESLTRAELETYAASLGIENPAGFSNKPELIDAIESLEQDA